jgi:predicted nuclease of restriction endonuclease-like (RecB) superfamily
VSAKPTKRKSSAVARVSKRAAGLNYHAWSGGIASLLEEARRQSARHVNAILTATYWEIGRRIVEFVQQGEARAEYGDIIIEKLSHDLTKQFGRGFSQRNLEQMRLFYLQHPAQEISQTLSAEFSRQGLTTFFQSVSEKFLRPANRQTVSGKSSGKQIPQTVSAELEICGTACHKSADTEKCQTVSDKSLVPISATLSRKSTAPIYATASRISEIDLALYLEALCHAFLLSWSHYVRLLSVEQPEARKFYEIESLRGGWSVRQLDRQVSTLFYERTALAKNKAKLLTTGAKARPEDAVSVEEEIKSPYILEFLNLRDDYAENDLEDALVRHLEAFLLELGNDFTFVARQKKIRVGKQWYRIDLLLFHRRLRCLFIFDLKLGRFTHADAGQMNLYVNYAAEHLTLKGENPPVGLILCSEHDEAVARYSMGNVTNKILAAQYKLALPDPRLIEKEIEKTRRMLELRAKVGYKFPTAQKQDRRSGGVKC